MSGGASPSAAAAGAFVRSAGKGGVTAQQALSLLDSARAPSPPSDVYFEILSRNLAAKDSVTDSLMQGFREEVRDPFVSCVVCRCSCAGGWVLCPACLPVPLAWRTVVDLLWDELFVTLGRVQT